MLSYRRLILPLLLLVSIPACTSSTSPDVGIDGDAQEVASKIKLTGFHYRSFTEALPDCKLGFLKAIHFRTAKRFSAITNTCDELKGTLPNGTTITEEVLEDGIEGTYKTKAHADGSFDLKLTFHFGEEKPTYLATFGESGDQDDGALTLLLLDKGNPPEGDTASATNHLTAE